MWLDSKPPKRKPLLLCSSAAPHEGLCMHGLCRDVQNDHQPHVVQLPPSPCAPVDRQENKTPQQLNLKNKITRAPSHQVLQAGKKVKTVSSVTY